MKDTQELTLDAQINAAFAEGGNREPGESEETFNARNSAAARKVYDLTRALGLKRQLIVDAPEWRAPSGIPLNAFAKRYFGGLLGEGLPGYPFDEYARARVAAQAAPKKRARKVVNCPHCGGSLKEAA